jgi:hypothetical protein
MSRSSLLILLGVVFIIIPFSGLPSGFRTFLAIVCGALVLGLGVRERAHGARAAQQPAPEPAATLPPHGVSPV